MAYHIYHTEGLVLGGGDTGEDSRMVRIYTKELGLVTAKVQSVRKLASKHRYHLQDLSYGTFSFVRGKEIWRLVGSESNVSSPRFSDDPEKFRSLAKVSRLLGRLALEESMEEKERDFFREFLSNVRFLFREKFTREEIKCFETLLALKTLYHHGYWKSENGSSDLYKMRLSYEVLHEISEKRRELNVQIHESLEYSHL